MKARPCNNVVNGNEFHLARETLDYVCEKRDRRSLWFAATQKSDDVHLCYELGWEYREKAASFGMHRRNGPLPPEEAKHYASAVWKDDPRLPQLLAELAENQHSEPAEKEFKGYLLSNAEDNFDEA